MNKKSNPKTIVKKKAIPFINIFLCTLLFFINNIIENIINIISRNHTNLTLVLPNLIKYPTSICIYVNINIAIIFIYISFKLLFVKIIYKIIPINT